jgi:intracellular septation protein
MGRPVDVPSEGQPALRFIADRSAPKEMKLFFDFLPIILFFGAFKYAEGREDWAARFATEHLGGIVSGGTVGPNEAPVLLATVVVIVATLAQIGVLLARGRKVDLMLWVSLGLVLVLGGATIWFHSDAFIKWKPSVLYWIMGLAFWVSRAVFRKNLLQTLMGDQLHLPAAVWQRLNFAWIAFFALMGLANIYVAYAFSTETWVNFKVFGLIGLMLLFTLAQGLYLSRHLQDDGAGEAPAGKP